MLLDADISTITGPRDAHLWVLLHTHKAQDQYVASVTSLVPSQTRASIPPGTDTVTSTQALSVDEKAAELRAKDFADDIGAINETLRQVREIEIYFCLSLRKLSTLVALPHS